MTTTREQVLELIASGKISAAEGDVLLAALEAPPRSRWWMLINPFERMGTTLSISCGVVGALIGVGLSRLNVRFDGALDLHVSPLTVSLREAFADQLVAWPLVGLILWAAARVFARRGRVVDHVANVGVARLPLLLVGAVVAPLGNRLPTTPAEVESFSPLAMLVVVAVTLPAFIWMVTLLFQGFRTASGLRGVKCAVIFTAALILAEILSKVALSIAG